MMKSRLAAALLVALFLMASCGRKAPPRLPVYEQPPAPSSLTAVHREDTVMLAWDYPRNKIPYVREFKVLRSERMLAAIRETGYTDSDIRVGRTYEYTVFAVSTGGIVSDGSKEVVVDVKEVPGTPTGVVAEVVEEGVRLIWSHPREDVLFNVYRSPDRALSPLLPANPDPLTGNSYTDIPYADKPAYYTVRALLGGTARHEGPPSEVLEVRPEAFVPSAPKDLRAKVAGDKVLLAWQNNPEAWARSYTIYRSVDGVSYSLIGESRTPSFIDSEGLKGNLYYRVKALGPAVEGEFSGTAMVNME
jgi:predicted small lipoprotein YifL